MIVNISMWGHRGRGQGHDMWNFPSENALPATELFKPVANLVYKWAHIQVTGIANFTTVDADQTKRVVTHKH